MDKKFKDLTVQYALNTEDAMLNFHMAYEYHSRGHTASAASHYLRCAERADEDVLAYEALLRSYFCYMSQGNRTFTAVQFLRQAKILMPRRPEAYYLLALHYGAKTNESSLCHTECRVALEVCDFDAPPLMTKMGYDGKHSLLVLSAESGWQWDKYQYTRDTYFNLAKSDDFYDFEPHDQEKIRRNISCLGILPTSQNHIIYDKSMHDKLKYKFSGSDIIVNNTSQVLQDMFTLYMYDGKREGTYLEIGAGNFYKGNNTFVLEKFFGWKGVSVERDPTAYKTWENNRSNTILFGDALKLNYEKILAKEFDTNVIDYLQLDLEPSKNTFECLLQIPLETYKFGVITYEHDDYLDFENLYKSKSRRYLKSMGYELVIADVSTDGSSNFEDWWVHPDLINKDVIDSIKSLEGITDIGKHFFDE